MKEIERGGGNVPEGAAVLVRHFAENVPEMVRHRPHEVPYIYCITAGGGFGIGRSR